MRRGHWRWWRGAGGIASGKRSNALSVLKTAMAAPAG